MTVVPNAIRDFIFCNRILAQVQVMIEENLPNTVHIFIQNLNALTRYNLSLNMC